MNLKQDCLVVGQEIEGFEVIRISSVKRVEATFFELEHLETGAKYIHFAMDDEENVFGITFKTVPPNSTGVAHVLEHTVLCGSENYPVKDPFFGMMSRSLSTFMNAMTSADLTAYPFTAYIRKDFYNLMDVYLDAVFSPNLDYLSFLQEGHRLEFNKNGRLERKGVVYNETRGVFASPNQVMFNSLKKALMPDTSYRYSYGGFPKDIVSLTYGQLLLFYRQFYHPSNAYFFSYGSFELEPHLKKVNERISGFKRVVPVTKVNHQVRWKESRKLVTSYPIGNTENVDGKSQAGMAWLTAGIESSFEVFSLAMLENVLLSNDDSPLRRALLDSGLGTDIADCTGFIGGFRDTVFSCGLKEIDSENGRKVAELIVDTLQRLVLNGIDDRVVEAVIRRIKFAIKEVGFHYGRKKCFGSMITPWIHGVDPLRAFDLKDDLEEIERLISEGGFFEELIEKYFLNNPHRITYLIVPFHNGIELENRRERRELDKIQAGLSAGDKRRIVSDTEDLKKFQSAFQNPECLPMMRLKEVPPLKKSLKGEKPDPSSNFSHYQSPISGITYFMGVADVGMVEDEAILLLPLFCYAIRRVQTKRKSYREIAREIDTFTGGVAFDVDVIYNIYGTAMPMLELEAKCLEGREQEMFSLIEEILTEADFFDLERLRKLIGGCVLWMESSITDSGNYYARMLAARKLSRGNFLEEHWEGVHQLLFLKGLLERSDEELTEVAENLDWLLRIFAYEVDWQLMTVGNKGTCFYKKQVDELTINRKNKLGFLRLRMPEFNFEEGCFNEGWAIASTVSYVAASRKFYADDIETREVLAVIGELVSANFLHAEIREKGGAYGTEAFFGKRSGIFKLSSYRDPHIIRTLDTFERVAEWICNEDSFSELEVEMAALQVYAGMDTPAPQRVKATRAFYRDLTLASDDYRERQFKALLGIDKAKVLEVARRYFSADIGDFGCWSTAVISGRDKLEQARERQRQLLLKEI